MQTLSGISTFSWDMKLQRKALHSAMKKELQWPPAFSNVSAKRVKNLSFLKLPLRFRVWIPQMEGTFIWTLLTNAAHSTPVWRQRQWFWEMNDCMLAVIDQLCTRPRVYCTCERVFPHCFLCVRSCQGVSRSTHPPLAANDEIHFILTASEWGFACSTGTHPLTRPQIGSRGRWILWRGGAKKNPSVSSQMHPRG